MVVPIITCINRAILFHFVSTLRVCIPHYQMLNLVFLILNKFQAPFFINSRHGHEEEEILKKIHKFYHKCFDEIIKEFDKPHICIE